MNHMNKYPLLVAFTLVTLFSCTKESIEGSGTIVSEFRNIDYFDKISSNGVFEVSITQGEQQSVKVTTDDNIMPHLKTRVVNNELELYLDNDHNYKGLTVEIDIVTTNLEGLKNSGVGNMYVNDVDANKPFSIYNSGTGSIDIQGTSSKLNLINEGTGNIFAFNFLVNECNVAIEGSGDAEINCSNILDVAIEGSGSVYYKGFPTINTTISGSGKVISTN